MIIAKNKYPERHLKKKKKVKKEKNLVRIRINLHLVS